MTEHNRLPAYVASIIRRTNSAIRIITEISEDLFFKDAEKQHATAKCMCYIGRTIGRIRQRYPDFIRKNPDYPWNDIEIIGLLASHEYTDLDHRKVRLLIKEKFPAFVEFLQSIPDTELASIKREKIRAPELHGPTSS